MKISKKKLHEIIKSSILKKIKNDRAILKEDSGDAETGKNLPGERNPNPVRSELESIPVDWQDVEGAKGRQCYLDMQSAEDNKDINTVPSCTSYRNDAGLFFSDDDVTKKLKAQFVKADSGGLGGSLGKWYKFTELNGGNIPGLESSELLVRVSAGEKNWEIHSHLSFVLAFNKGGELTSGNDWVAHTVPIEGTDSWGPSYDTEVKLQYKNVDHVTFAYKSQSYSTLKGTERRGQYDGVKVDDVPTEWADTVTSVVQAKMAEETNNFTRQVSEPISHD
jgi:hypothetical protein